MFTSALPCKLTIQTRLIGHLPSFIGLYYNSSHTIHKTSKKIYIEKPIIFYKISTAIIFTVIVYRIAPPLFILDFLGFWISWAVWSRKEANFFQVVDHRGTARRGLGRLPHSVRRLSHPFVRGNFQKDSPCQIPAPLPITSTKTRHRRLIFVLSLGGFHIQNQR